METITATVVEGHGVASGRGGDPRFPRGTIAMQVPFFREMGLDLSEWHLATINLLTAPRRFVATEAIFTFRQIKWHPTEPAEDFSFFECSIKTGAESWQSALVYYPHPETKPEHFQPADVIEIIVGHFLPDIEPGKSVQIRMPGANIV